MSSGRPPCLLCSEIEDRRSEIETADDTEVVPPLRTAGAEACRYVGYNPATAEIAG